MTITAMFREKTMAGGIAAILAIGLFACARVEMKPTAIPPEELHPEGKYRGVLIPDNTLLVSLEGVVVTTGAIRLFSNAKGDFSLPDLPVGKHLLVAEKRFAGGSVRRVMGVEKVFVTERGPDPVRIRLRDATDVDAFCLDCHPPMKQVTRKDQIFRDIHVSGVVAKRGNADRSLLDADGKITCESCHTIHVPGFPKYGVGDIKSGAFCNRCHGGP